MTIAAISNNYSLYKSYEYHYFGGIISLERLKSLMQEYGILPTGDAFKDISNLYAVMYKEAKSEVQGNSFSAYTIKESGPLSQTQQASHPSQAITAQNSSNVPWASLMNQLGLFVSGNLDEDYGAFTTKISAMLSSGALSQQDKATLEQMVAEASTVFVQANAATSHASHQQQGASQLKAPSGIDIKAQLNKLYFAV